MLRHNGMDTAIENVFSILIYICVNIFLFTVLLIIIIMYIIKTETYKQVKSTQLMSLAHKKLVLKRCGGGNQPVINFL